MKKKKKSTKKKIPFLVEAADRTMEVVGIDKIKMQEQREKALISYFSDNPPAFNCKHCGNNYQPEPRQWIFHNLCDTCFPLFDKQKMEGRIDLLIYKRQTAYFEDSDAWSNAVKNSPFHSLSM